MVNDQKSKPPPASVAALFVWLEPSIAKWKICLEPARQLSRNRLPMVSGSKPKDARPSYPAAKSW